MTPVCPPSSNNQPTNTDPGTAPDQPTDSDNPPADTNNDNTDTSDDDESDCQTVRLNDNKSFAQTEMKFRDIYDDIVAILPSSSGNDIYQCEPTPPVSSAEKKIISQSSQPITDITSQPTGLSQTVVETDKVREVLVEADPEKGSLVKAVSEISMTNPFYEAGVEKISESSETLSARASEERERGERKPRSCKKTRAPPPPSLPSQSSLLSPSDQIIHLSPSVSPATTRKRSEALELTEVTPEPEAPVISASLGAENGKIIYRSKGFSEETILADTLPQRVELVTAPTSAPTLPTYSTPEFSSPVVCEPKPVNDPFPDKEWKFLGQSDITEDKDLLKPIPDKLYPRDTRDRDRDTTSESHQTGLGSTRLFTYSPSTGLTKLRKYDLDQGFTRPASPPVRGERERPASPRAERIERPERPLSPLLPRSEYYSSGEESSSRCPHCTIHSWLPHSPGCLNKRK